MSIRRPHRPPFAQRTRSAQKRAYRKVLNNIRRLPPTLGGRFYTHQYVHGDNGWLDVYFLGLRKPLFYNATLQTTRHAYKELVWDRAWDLSFEVAPTEHDLPVWEGVYKDPATGRYITSAREPHRYPELGGLTRLDWVYGQLAAIADRGETSVMEGWSLHRGYHSGIGLHATLDVPSLTVEAVNAFIDRFLQSPTALAAGERRSFRFDQIDHWDLESNAIVDV